MDALQNVRGISIVLLDACRNDPALSGPVQRDAAQLRGLDCVTARGQQNIAFATEPGRTAADGAGRNSSFTAAHLKHLATPGIELELMMKRVFEDVRTETKQKQVPWQHSSLTKSFMFKSGGVTGAAAQSRPLQVANAAAPLGLCDDLYLEAQRAVDRVRGFGEFIGSCPDHDKVPEARRMRNRAVDNQACDRALRERSISALKDYLDDFPSGGCSTEVKAELENKLVAQRKLTDQQRRDEDDRRREAEARSRDVELRKRERELAEDRQKQRERELQSQREQLERDKAQLEQQRTAGLTSSAESINRWLPPAASPSAGPTLWNHNGSTMRLVADGNIRRFSTSDRATACGKKASTAVSCSSTASVVEIPIAVRPMFSPAAAAGSMATKSLVK